VLFHDEKAWALGTHHPLAKQPFDHAAFLAWPRLAIGIATPADKSREPPAPNDLVFRVILETDDEAEPLAPTAQRAARGSGMTISFARHQFPPAIIRTLDSTCSCSAKSRSSQEAISASRRLMTIPGVGQLTALAFVAAIDDPSRIRRSRDIGAYLGLVPRRYQSGEVDYVGSISKCGDRRVRTLLDEAANVMLTRYKGQLKLKDWAFAIARRSTMRKARIAVARRLAIIMHAMLRDGTEFGPA
jgi:transposase